MERMLSLADESELEASLRRMGLLQPGQSVPLTPLTGGVSSQIVRADLPTGPICIKRALAQLKVSTEWLAPVKRNEAEAAWIALVGKLVPGSVPEILGEDWQAHAFAMSYFDLAQYPVWKQQLHDGVTDTEIASLLGHRLAQIHDGTAHRRDLAIAFAHDESFHALRIEPYFLATAEANPDCSAALRELSVRTASSRIALVHGDVSPKNILIGPQGPVFLDAECAWYGDPAFDIAFCLTHLLLKCIWSPQFAAGLLSCFDAVAEGYLSHVTWESRENLERRAASLLPALLLARIDGKSPVEYIKDDSQRQMVRSFAKPKVIAPLKALTEIRQAWSEEIA